MSLKSLILYGSDVGPNPYKVEIILQELGLSYENNHLDFPELKKPEYESKNPNGRYGSFLPLLQNLLSLLLFFSSFFSSCDLLTMLLFFAVSPLSQTRTRGSPSGSPALSSSISLKRMIKSIRLARRRRGISGWSMSGCNIRFAPLPRSLPFSRLTSLPHTPLMSLRPNDIHYVSLVLTLISPR